MSTGTIRSRRPPRSIAVDEDRPAARGFDLLNERALTVAGVYGANASGKSNVLEALAWLSAAVGSSLRAWDEFIPREPFKFGKGPSSPSMFELEMVVRGVRHTYHVELDETAVLFEGLYSYPEKRRRLLFEREGMDVSFRRGLGGLVGTRELLTPTTLALSAAMRFEAGVRELGLSIFRIGVLGSRRSATWRLLSPAGSGFGVTASIFGDRQSATYGVGMNPSEVDVARARMLLDEAMGRRPIDRESALTLLRLADLGIYDVQVRDDASHEGNQMRGRLHETHLPREQIMFVHRAGQQSLPFELDDESEGTRTWFSLIGPGLQALRDGSVLLFDEIDASLHPRLSGKLIELFQDPSTNPRGAQLIFTSHDTSLLNHLNRDEVWLTEKGDDGATSLTALAEYGGDKVRRSLNLEKAYLQGRFGAVPELDQVNLRRALGLAADDS